jgi:hypothetical protein
VVIFEDEDENGNVLEKLQEDFQYNLKLLEERDQEIHNLEDKITDLSLENKNKSISAKVYVLETKKLWNWQSFCTRTPVISILRRKLIGN